MSEKRFKYVEGLRKIIDKEKRGRAGQATVYSVKETEDLLNELYEQCEIYHHNLKECRKENKKLREKIENLDNIIKE